MGSVLDLKLSSTILQHFQPFGGLEITSLR